MQLTQLCLCAAFAAALCWGCERVVETEEDVAADDAAANPLGGVDVIDCPSKKPWAATIVATDVGFSPPLVRVAQGHIVMFARAEGSSDEMIADDGSFRTDEPGDDPSSDPVCLRFSRVGAYPYHSDRDPSGMRGIVEIH